MNKDVKVWIKLAASVVTMLTINDIVLEAVVVPWLDK